MYYLSRHCTNGASIMERCTALAMSRRSASCRRLARVGFTRLVSNTTNSPRSGSTQMLVPVNPVCPNDRGEKYTPALECSLGVSQPSARLEAGDWRAVQRATVVG